MWAPQDVASVSSLTLPANPAPGWLVTEARAQAGSTVWHIDLAEGRPASDAIDIWLSPEECTRAARFRRREDHDRFVRSHQALRHILARYLGTSPAVLRFRSDPGGKPELEGPDRDRLHFNLSHSGGHALIGIGDGVPIGADVEAIRPIGDPMSVARAHFHPGEIADLMRLPVHRRIPAFFACWTRKEAVAKALGAGLLIPLDGFRVSVLPAPAALLQGHGAEDSAPAWTLHACDPAPDAVATVAIAQRDAPCAFHRLAPGWAAGA